MPYTSSARFTWADEAQRSGMRGCVANTTNVYGNMGVYRGAVNGTDNKRVPAAWTAENALQFTTDAWAPAHTTAVCLHANCALLQGKLRGTTSCRVGATGARRLPFTDWAGRHARHASCKQESATTTQSCCDTADTHAAPNRAIMFTLGKSSSARMGCLLTDRLASSSAAAFQSTCRTC